MPPTPPGEPRDPAAAQGKPLGLDCLHVYEARADRPPVPVTELEAVLSSDERERATRLWLERDRRRSIVAWGLLRMTIGGLVGKDPASLELRRDSMGKPVLEGGPSFNLSHSGEHILIAAAPEGRVGVDVEVVRPLPDVDTLAEMTLAPDEVESLGALDPSQRERAFFRIWTRKEALIKALGAGLSIPLNSFSVSPAAGSHPTLLRLDLPGEEHTQWSVWWFARGPDAEAAVAWDRPGAELRRYELRGTAPDASLTMDPGLWPST